MKNAYKNNGFENREEYLASLSEEYGSDVVEALSTMLPESEDFDGLISELECYADMY